MPANEASEKPETRPGNDADIAKSDYFEVPDPEQPDAAPPTPPDLVPQGNHNPTSTPPLAQVPQGNHNPTSTPPALVPRSNHNPTAPPAPDPWRIGGGPSPDGWSRNQMITHLFSYNASPGVWVWVHGTGWKRLSPASESGHSHLLLLAVTAKNNGLPVDYHEDASGQIDQLLV
ncbi:hypothetical protein [Amycolatopsis aidingensis]|uniref:hypothetical protein n=1 Tax=Amycolatopsis aidingensis TaxID=2842453 RepID=UPI001C0B3DB8|nr:hypothetical protein [Amycolatopsis aidingensis]